MYESQRVAQSDLSPEDTLKNEKFFKSEEEKSEMKGAKTTLSCEKRQDTMQKFKNWTRRKYKTK